MFLSVLRKVYRLTFHSYSEAVNLLYSSFSFDLMELNVAYRFLSRVPPQRLNLIRSFELFDIDTPASYRYPKPPKEPHPTTEERWLRICSVLRNMDALKTLVITFIKEYGPPLLPDQELKMLKPLVGVRAPENGFVLRLPWAETDKLGQISGVAFQVQRGEHPGFYRSEFDRAAYSDPTRLSRSKKAARDVVVGAGIIVFAVLCLPCIAM